jgi:hypothetical protein
MTHVGLRKCDFGDSHDGQCAGCYVVYFGGTLLNFGVTGGRVPRNAGNFKADSNPEAKYRL